MPDKIHLHTPFPADLVQRYKDAGYWRGETFGALLRERAQRFGDRTAVVGGEQRWSYVELDRRASAVAAGLHKLGLKRGDRVLVQLPNIPEFMSVIFGLFRAGMLPVYALPAYRMGELAHFANTAGVRAYVCAGDFGGFDYRQLARELQRRCPQIEHVIVAQGDAGLYLALTDLEASGDGVELPASISYPQDTAFLQTSGGTTGLPKLIPRTHDDYIYTLRESARICGLDETSIFLCALPMTHNFPMSSPGFLGTLYAGGCSVLSPVPDPTTCFELIERERATFTSLVPPLLLLWLEAAAATPRDLSTLQVIQVGGAKLVPEVAKRVAPILHAKLQQVFGNTEGLVNYTRLDDDEQTILETQGRPISPDDEILIVDDDNQPLPRGVAGHLLTRGPYTIRGYYNNPQANEKSFTAEGYYRSGDIVRMTENGYLVVEGRAGDHINRAGEKISAEEIENHLLAHPQVFDAAVVSIPDERLGERSCAFIVTKGARPRKVALKQWILDRGLAAFKAPDQIVFVDVLNETPALKISRKALRDHLRERLQTQETQAAATAKTPS